MYTVAVIKVNNIMHDLSAYENPVTFAEFSEAIIFAKPLIESGYNVAIFIAGEEDE